MPSQSAKPGAQMMPQLPAVQVPVPLAVPHTLPQAPQLVSEFKFASQPSSVRALQLAKPVLHEPTWQVPAVQISFALGRLHALLHAPQCATEDVVAVSQPLTGSLSQLPKPASQAVPHTPPLHRGTPLLLLHTVVQEPQRVGSVVRFTSHPLEARPSQLAQPGLHVTI